MKLVRLSRAVVFAGALCASPAWADPVTSPSASPPIPSPSSPSSPPPTRAQLERAKKAFAEGKRLHDAGKLPEAIEKFKASYALSKNPLLLYNIGVTMEELGADNLDLAVVSYRRFLAEAPADAPQRQDVTDRIAAITAKLAPARPAEPAPPSEPATAPAPAHTYGPADFAHQAVETAPPGAPLDITATAPPDAGFTVILYFRGADEPGFASTPMRRHNDELVARVPAARMAGRALQYYLEVRDPGGTVITRAGKPSSPNVVAIEAGAPPKFSSDVTEGPITPAPPVELGLAGHDKEDPMAHAAVDAPAAGPSALTIARWTTTGVALAGIAAGITFYALAVNHSNALENDVTGCGTPPCQRYDQFDRDLQHTGKRDQTIANVTLFSGIAVAAAAGYLWFRELSERGAHAAGHARNATPPPRWAIAPSIGNDTGGYTGAAAAVRF